jgi:tripartite ATP-independent transporter DctM subunit
MSTSLVILLVFFGVALIGMPLAFSLGLAAIAGVLVSDIELNLLPSRMMSAVNAFPLMSIPFFILAGELMLKAGMMERLIDLANAVVGRVRGGLGHVTIFAGLGLSTVSGAAVADASALGSTLMPSLKKHYGTGFSAALCAAAANLGPIIPPSGAMIVYAFMAGPSVSVGGLFMAGIVPGLLLVAGMMAMNAYIAKKRNFPLTGDAFSWRRIGHEVKRSWIIFLMPVVVIGGIVGGAFTATEGSAIAVVYALAIGFLVTRNLSLADLPEALVRTAITSAVVGAMIAFASVVTYMLTIDQMPSKLLTLIQSLTDSPIGYLLIVALVLFIVGMFLESNAAYIMLVPLLHPIAIKFGIDPLHFGFLFVFNLVIGMLTPPVGVVLFVICGLSGLKLGELAKHVWPFIALMYGLLFVCMFVPQLVLTVPRALGY